QDAPKTATPRPPDQPDPAHVTHPGARGNERRPARRTTSRDRRQRSDVRFAGPCGATSRNKRHGARPGGQHRATSANKRRPVRWAVRRGRAAVGGARCGGRRDRGWWAGIAPAGPARGVRGPAGAIVWVLAGLGDGKGGLAVDAQRVLDEGDEDLGVAEELLGLARSHGAGQARLGGGALVGAGGEEGGPFAQGGLR